MLSYMANLAHYVRPDQKIASKGKTMITWTDKFHLSREIQTDCSPGLCQFKNWNTSLAMAKILNCDYLELKFSSFLLLFPGRKNAEEEKPTFLTGRGAPILSWKETSTICQSVGGHLPTLFDLLELHKILDILSLPCTDIIEALFVGLHTNHKVSKTYMCQHFKQLSCVKYFL